MGAIELLFRLAFRSFSAHILSASSAPRFTFRKSLAFRNSRLALLHRFALLLPSWFQFHQLHAALSHHHSFFAYFPPLGAIRFRSFPFGLDNMISRSRTVGITRFRAGSGVLPVRVDFSVLSRPTLRSSRTPPALPSALSQHFAISAPLVVSVQAWPLSFIR